MLVEAAAADLGSTLLPLEVAGPLIKMGRLVRLLPKWRSTEMTVHLVYPSKRGMRPAVRAFIDFLSDHVSQSIRAANAAP